MAFNFFIMHGIIISDYIETYEAKFLRVMLVWYLIICSWAFSRDLLLVMLYVDLLIFGGVLLAWYLIICNWAFSEDLLLVMLYLDLLIFGV